MTVLHLLGLIRRTLIKKRERSHEEVTENKKKIKTKKSSKRGREVRTEKCDLHKLKQSRLMNVFSCLYSLS